MPHGQRPSGSRSPAGQRGRANAPGAAAPSPCRERAGGLCSFSEGTVLRRAAYRGSGTGGVCGVSDVQWQIFSAHSKAKAQNQNTVGMMPTVGLGPGRIAQRRTCINAISFPCFPNTPEDTELILQFNDKGTRTVSILFKVQRTKPGAIPGGDAAAGWREPATTGGAGGTRFKSCPATHWLPDLRFSELPLPHPKWRLKSLPLSLP